MVNTFAFMGLSHTQPHNNEVQHEQQDRNSNYVYGSRIHNNRIDRGHIHAQDELECTEDIRQHAIAWISEVPSIDLEWRASLDLPR